MPPEAPDRITKLDLAIGTKIGFPRHMKLDVSHFSEPIFRQPDILELTLGDERLLQIWVQRGHVPLAEPNPGRGRFRMYSRLDAVGVKIRFQLNPFGIDVGRSSGIAEAVKARLLRDGAIDLRSHLVLDAHRMQGPAFTPRAEGVAYLERDGDVVGQVFYAGYDHLHMLGEEYLDADHDPIAKLTKPWIGATRASAPVQCVLVIPIGEIVTDTLAELDRIAEARREGRDPWERRNELRAALNAERPGASGESPQR
jgi:hypothetical protein